VTKIDFETTISDEEANWAVLQCQALARDTFTCLSCGHWGDGAFPRVQRPSAGPAITRDLADLVTLCNSCRELVVARDSRMHYRGMWLDPAEDPAEKPVYVIAGLGYDVRWLLPGGTSTGDPGETAG
jgi:5-methylcytosine-specific restriction endonuclease McrA